MPAPLTAWRLWAVRVVWRLFGPVDVPAVLAVMSAPQSVLWPLPQRGDQRSWRSDDDFPLGVSCLQIPKRFTDLAQWIGSVDHRLDLPSRDELVEERHVFFLEGFPPQESHLLAPASEINGPKNRQAQIRLVEPPSRTYTPLVFSARRHWKIERLPATSTIRSYRCPVRV